MPDESLENIIKRLRNSDAWLSRAQAKHIAFVQRAVKSLEDDILNSILQLQITKTGKIQGLRTNIENMKAVHRDIAKSFLTDFDAETRKLVTTFKTAKLDVARNYEVFGEDITFTGADEEVFDVLKAADRAQYASISKTAQDRVTQALYNNVIGSGTIGNLADEIRNVTTGIKTLTGRPLSSYAELYANDMIMNFHNKVNLYKGEQIGMNRFLYYGGLIASSRPFCIDRVGKSYTRKEIDSWTFKWKGKRGDAWNFRGGWNCRHHWQPVRKKWLDKYSEGELEAEFSRIFKKK